MGGLDKMGVDPRLLHEQCERNRTETHRRCGGHDETPLYTSPLGIGADQHGNRGPAESADRKEQTDRPAVK